MEIQGKSIIGASICSAKFIADNDQMTKKGHDEISTLKEDLTVRLLNCEEKVSWFQ